jgi:RNA polymerase sigma-70 factor (ECF subfamily)
MENENALPNAPSALGRQMRLIAAGKHGVEAAQVRWIGRDPELFDAFYREHIEDVQRFVARRIGDRERAADLTAEIFIAAIESSERFKGRAAPRTWLFGIARRVIANDARTRGRERSREEQFIGAIAIDEGDAARMDARLDAAAQSRRLYAAMEKVPEGERAILELVAIDELSVAEAAAAVGVRPVTARVRLHRARRRLRDELALEANAASRTDFPDHLDHPGASAIEEEEHA